MPLELRLRVLTECFHEGFQLNSIEEFRSTISAYHDSIGGIPVRSNQRVSALLSGSFSNRLTQPKYTLIWNVKLVIEFLETLTYDSDFSLIDLKSRLTMLLALTSAALASEILTKGI